MMRCPRRPLSTFALVVIACCVAERAAAEPTLCRRAVAKAGAQHVQKIAKALAACAAARMADPSHPACPDDIATTKIAKSAATLRAAIDKRCGGLDAVCGGDFQEEDVPRALGWPTLCPNVLHGDCRNAITDCGDIATCLDCTARAATGQAIGLATDDLALPSVDPIRTCQRAIAKATTAFVVARSKALRTCRDARLKGKHTNECVPPALGDGKYLAVIAKAAAKRTAAVCKACGGPDQRCDGIDDVAAAAVGAPTQCPTVAVPSGSACGGPIADVAALDACLGCVAGFDTSCTDRIALPGVTTYPSECNACLAPAPTGACPSAIEFTADGPAVDLDTGSTGYAHDATIPTNGRLTLAVTGCTGASQPSCGTCTVAGPIANAGGAAFDSQRCVDAPWISCTGDGDCTSAGATGPCSFFFGPPLPLVAGGVSTCVLNRVSGPVFGTIDLGDGSASTNVPLASTVYRTGTVSHPCPVCSDGTCQAGSRVTLPCTPQGTGEFGAVSLDCPPTASTNVGTLTIPLAIATGTQTLTLDVTSPQCGSDPSLRCPCDTCNGPGALACATNADCPPSGGSPGICGGRRCLGGANAGGPCSSASACPGGSCSKIGPPTKPHECADDSSTPIDGSRCVDVGGNEGLCPDGPILQTCSVETHRGCGSDADCNPPPYPGSTCTDCRKGQRCEARLQPCFTGDGIAGGATNVTGATDVPCGGIAYPTLGSLFCVAPVGASAVNTAAGLPGLGRIRLSGRVVVAGP